ncbi:Peptidase_S24 domain-containing protein [Vibrio chagasii]|nr:Peptidase_S24 domain-containing protein [Vibrio chagasii]
MNTKKIRVNQIFREIRKAKKYQQDGFQEIVSRSFLSRFETGESELTASKFFACLDKMGVTMSDVISATAKLNDPDVCTYIPEFEWNALKTKRRTPKGHVTYAEGASKFAFALEVTDDSMISSNSAFPIGSKIIVEPAVSASDGELVIVGNRQQYFFRRWAAGYALSDNESYAPIDEPIVVGKVVGVIWTANLKK